MTKLILLLTLLFALPVAAQWQQTTGPAGAFITNLTQVNGKLIVEVRNGNLYRLDGQRWTKLPNTSALDYYTANDHLLLTRYDGVHTSTDEGATWHHTLDQMAAPKLVTDADTVYSIHGNAFYRSNDKGLTWVEVQHQPAIGPLAIMNGVLIAGPANGAGVLRSVNGGSTFTLSSDGLPDTARVGALTSDHGFIYAGTNAGIFASSDLGLTWSRFEAGLPGGMPTGYKRLLRTGEFAFLHTDDTIYVATLNGWKVLLSHALQAIVEHESVIYAVDRGRIMTSFFLGDDWNETTPDLLANTVRHITVAGQSIMATGAWGIFRTNDDGLTWDRVSDMQAHLFVSTGSTIHALGSNADGSYHLVRSYDQGSTWRETTVLDKDPRHIMALARTTGFLYAGLSEQDMLGGGKWLDGGVYRSTDRGVTWSDASNGLPQQQGVTVPVIGMYADDELQLVSTIEGLYRSTDGGDIWTKSNYGSGEVGEYNPIHFQRVGSTVYAGSTNMVFRTTDAGASWSEVSRDHELIMGMGRFEDTVYIVQGEGDGLGLYRLHGNEWVSVTHRLPAGIEPLVILEGGLRAYMGTIESGVWVYRKTASVNDDMDRATATYPNPASEQVTIDVQDKNVTQASITIYDALGRAVLVTSGEVRAGAFTIQLGELPDGVYTYTIESLTRRLKGKLTIRH